MQSMIAAQRSFLAVPAARPLAACPCAIVHWPSRSPGLLPGPQLSASHFRHAGPPTFAPLSAAAIAVSATLESLILAGDEPLSGTSALAVSRPDSTPATSATPVSLPAPMRMTDPGPPSPL